MPRGGIRPGQGRKRIIDKRQYIGLTDAQTQHVQRFARYMHLNFAQAVRLIVDCHEVKCREIEDPNW